INRKTAERWIKSGQLPAVKLGGHWVVQARDIAAFLKRRVFLLGRELKRMLFFSPEVLEIYRHNPGYYLQESAFHGRIGKNEDQNLMHSARSARIYNWNKEAFGKGEPSGLVWFPEMPFWKIGLLEDGGYVVAVDPRVFNHLPRPEQAKWLRYQITNPRI
ncbi:MAG: helix-turn-helix domain-containing protein, partial [Planctomycetes bacterium]|nr:helix-turn-helix domain-containing protein [Planctomycetota bacterium]